MGELLKCGRLYGLIEFWRIVSQFDQGCFQEAGTMKFRGLWVANAVWKSLRIAEQLGK
ncbi:Uncharacterised protein [Vibrio cholerae]|nr:Uncharacterised protein [Vibrio cholerae]